LPDTAEKLLSNKEYCLEQLREAREIFSNKNTTEEKYDAMEKALGMIYLYCPDEIKEIAYAYLHEATIRKSYFIIKWGC
jgi:hypothetical protein